MTISRFWTLMLSAISIALVVSVPQSRAALPPDGGDSGQSAIYGAHAVFSSNIWQFRQWADAMDRAQRELAQTRICADAADTGCTPRQWRTLIDELARLPLRAKLDLVIEMLSRLSYRDVTLPELCEVELGLDRIAWSSPQPMAAGTWLRLQLFFHDAYRENVEKLIEQKKKGQAITTEPKPRRAPVVDLMEALKKSLKNSASAKASKTARRRKVA